MSNPALPPTPPTTLAIILGASAWPDSPGLHSSKAFAVAGQGFKNYIFSQKGLALPKENVCDLFDKKTSASDQSGELARFLKRRTKELNVAGQAARDVLVYFVGHGGFPNSSDDFYLLPRLANENFLRGTGIHIQALADALEEEARLLRWYVILDCCYSAAALRVFMGGPDQVAVEKAQMAFRRSSTPGKGVALFCSSDRNTPSRLLPNESCTTFSRALLDALRNGAEYYPSHMSLRHVSELTRDRLVDLVENPPHPNLHSDQQEWGDVADVLLFPNPKFVRPQTHAGNQTASNRPGVDEPSPDAPHTFPQQSSRPEPRTGKTVKPQSTGAFQRFVLLGLVALVIATLGSGMFWLTIHQSAQTGAVDTSSTKTVQGSPTATAYISPTATLHVSPTATPRPSPAGVITKFPFPNSGLLSLLTPGASPPPPQPLRITAGTGNTLWFTYDGGIGRFVSISQINAFSLPNSASSANRITFGPDGNLWFTESIYTIDTNNPNNNRVSRSEIGRITPDGKITEFPLANPASDPNGIVAGPDGALWFTDNDGIGRITPNGQFRIFPISSSFYPAGITAGPDGALWFIDTDKIGRITTSGQITTFSIPTPTSFSYGITAGPDGALWFTSYDYDKNGNTANSRIERMTTNGHVTVFPLQNAAGPQEIIAGSDGNLWFIGADTKIRRITASGQITDFLVPNIPSYCGINCIDGITAGPGNKLWFTYNTGKGAEYGIGSITDGK